LKVAMMAAWNTDSGASIHAEYIGRTMVEKGVDLKVYSFFKHSFHGTTFTEITPEEPYVTECFTVYSDPAPKFNTKPLMDSDFDIFVAEDLGMLPMKQMLEIFPQIKKRAKTVNVVHDNKLSKKPEYFCFDWDHVVCFDKRYYRFLKKKYPRRKISIIPYPCHPLVPGDKTAARKELGLPQDKKIIFIFGQAAKFVEDANVALDCVAQKYDMTLVVASKDKNVLDPFIRIKPKAKFGINLVKSTLDRATLYKYLHAADCMIYNKPSIEGAVVSSTIFQCMGAGCPIVARNSSFTYSFGREVIKYRHYYELEDSIIDVFAKGRRYRAQQKAVVKYLKKNSMVPVTERFMGLFEDLLKKK